MFYALKLVSPNGERLGWLNHYSLSAVPYVYSNVSVCETGCRMLNRDTFELNKWRKEVGDSKATVTIHCFQSEADLPWRYREEKRFRDGTYKHLPWHNEVWFGILDDKKELQALHFAHVSLDDVTKIAFTENEDKGERDIQTRMKPGRYLSRFYSDVLTEKEIQYYAGVFASHYDTGELHLATTREDIRWVYENGPNSCMSHRISDYATNGIHPCEVYAAGDLAIAYIKSEKRVTARAVVWPDKKIASRIYGDYHRLSALLETVGYNLCPWDNEWYGARLLKIRAANAGYVAPYTDFHPEFDIENDYLVCVAFGDLTLQQTNGTTTEGMHCYHCGDHFDEEEGSCINSEFVCDCCRNLYCFFCDECCEYHYESDTDLYETAHGRTICSYCYNHHYVTCEECDGVVYSHETQETHEYTIVCDGCAQYLNYTPCGELTTNDEPLTVCSCRECERERDRIEEEEGETISLPQTGRTDDPCQQSLI